MLKTQRFIFGSRLSTSIGVTLLWNHLRPKNGHPSQMVGRQPKMCWKSPIAGWINMHFRNTCQMSFAKDCLLTLVKSRLALGSPGCSFVCLFVRHHAENGPIHRKMVVDCPLVIISKVKLFFRPDKTRKKEWMVQPVFCIVDAGSCFLPCQQYVWSLPGYSSKNLHLFEVYVMYSVRPLQVDCYGRMK